MDAHEVGVEFLDALTTREYDKARSLLADDVRCRMLVPSGLMTEANADATIGRFIGWYATADPFEVEASRAGEVEGRATIMYRFRLHDSDGWQTIEQHLMLDVNA